MAGFSLEDLERIVAERGRSADAQSWTARLFAQGANKATEKFGEEAVETIVAAVSGDRRALVAESADMIYHWLVVLALSDVRLEEVLSELEARTTQSGIAEKSARSSR